MSADTPSQVATAAEITAALPLHELSLIGLFSGPSSRTALLRDKSGKIARGSVGETVFGVTITALDDTTLHGKNARGQAVTLQMPNG